MPQLFLIMFFSFPYARTYTLLNRYDFTLEYFTETSFISVRLESALPKAIEVSVYLVLLLVDVLEIIESSYIVRYHSNRTMCIREVTLFFISSYTYAGVNRDVYAYNSIFQCLYLYLKCL